MRSQLEMHIYITDHKVIGQYCVFYESPCFLLFKWQLRKLVYVPNIDHCNQVLGTTAHYLRKISG